MPTHNVTTSGHSFTPKSIAIGVGDTVQWDWNDGMQHSVTADDGSFDSGILDPPGTFSQTFTAAGTFPYFCQVHGGPRVRGMSGTVKVA